MRHKLLFLFFLLIIISLVKPDWIKNTLPLGEHVIKTISIPSSIQVDSYATAMGGTLTSPIADHQKVDGVVTISGSVRKIPDLPSPYVWIQITYLGQKQAEFPSSFHYYVPMKKGNFQQKARLFCGKGKYSVIIRIAGEEKNMYTSFASFEVINTNPGYARDISYGTEANEVGLHMNSPQEGVQVAANAIQIKGNFTKRYKRKTVLVQVRKGKKVWRRVFPCSGGPFQEQIPLLFGKGIHEIQVMIPDSQRAEYYLEGATFFAQNESPQTWNPIQYTNLYKERGIQLTTPIAGGNHQGLTFCMAGTINPQVKDAKNTDHLVVRTTKGKEEATYFIPVTNYHFNSNIYFRFGSGSYTVDLLVPENTKSRRDYFRFFTAAQFKVSVQGIEDVRDLLPSRGINSDDVRIIRLANQLTQGKETEMDKAKAIYTYVAKNMTYDVRKLKENTFSWNDSSLASLQLKKGVCQDYVFLSLALLRAAGIPSRFVEGIAGGQPHAWVEARIKGWISMDPTWGSGYIAGERFMKKFDDSYFNPSLKKWNETHRRRGVIY